MQLYEVPDTRTSYRRNLDTLLDWFIFSVNSPYVRMSAVMSSSAMTAAIHGLSAFSFTLILIYCIILASAMNLYFVSADCISILMNFGLFRVECVAAALCQFNLLMRSLSELFVYNPRKMSYQWCTSSRNRMNGYNRCITIYLLSDRNFRYMKSMIYVIRSGITQFFGVWVCWRTIARFMDDDHVHEDELVTIEDVNLNRVKKFTFWVYCCNDFAVTFVSKTNRSSCSCSRTMFT